MDVAFGTVLIVVVLVAGLVAVVSYLGTADLYRGIGRGGFSLDHPDRKPAPPVGSAAARAETEEEVRQLVEAKSARREARGQAPLDVDAEVDALLRPPEPSTDQGLREEVRQLVIARNGRRVARGQAPLDVEEEVERQLRDLG